MDIHGSYEGGGVCQNCQHFTEGINCDKCIHGYYRPYGKLLNNTDACQRKFTGVLLSEEIAIFFIIFLFC